MGSRAPDRILRLAFLHRTLKDSVRMAVCRGDTANNVMTGLARSPTSFFVPHCKVVGGRPSSINLIKTRMIDSEIRCSPEMEAMHEPSSYM
jgi:hypothetical protein